MRKPCLRRCGSGAAALQRIKISALRYNGQLITARAYGQVALGLCALPRGATICATLHDAPPHDPQIVAFTMFLA